MGKSLPTSTGYSRRISEPSTVSDTVHEDAEPLQQTQDHTWSITLVG